MATKKKKVEASNVLDGNEWWDSYRNVTYVRALELTEPISEPSGKAGDFLVVGTHGDHWVIEREDFFQRYKPLTPNKS